MLYEGKMEVAKSQKILGLIQQNKEMEGKLLALQNTLE
jgi:hypothetical protein